MFQAVITAESFLRSHWLLGYSIISQCFTEHQGSLLCLHAHLILLDLIISGGGSVFLKSRQQKQDSPTVASSSPTPEVGLSPASDEKLVPSRDQAENLPKSILRGDQQRPTTPGKPLWDVDPREMSSMCYPEMLLRTF
jgi:hypothetical protein